MKYKLLLLLCVAFVSTIQAQTVEFIEPRNVQSAPEAEFSTFTVGDRFYVLQKKYRMMAPVMYDLQLDVYDGNRKPVGSNIIDKMLEPYDANIYQGMYAMKNQLVMFKSEYSKSSGAKMSYLWVYPFDATGKRQPKKMIASFPVDGAGNSGNFRVNVSPDGTKIAVVNEWPFEKEGMEKCTVSLFDDQFRQVWKKDYTFGYESTRAPKNNVFVNNNGTVFILKQINLKKAFDQFSMFSFLENGKNIIEKKIDLGNGFTIATYKSIFTESGNLQVAGYSFMSKKFGVNVETPDGIFYLQANGATGDLKAKLTTMSPSSLEAAQLIRMSDNSVCLAGEHRLTSSSSVPGKLGEFSYSYKYGAVQLNKFNPDGELQWSYAFERDFKSANDGAKLSGSYTWTDGNDLKILFADYWVRHDDKKQFISFVGARVNLIQTIDVNGKLKGEDVIMDPRIGGKKGDYLFVPSTGTLYKDRKLFMLASRGLELVGATISY